MGFWDLLLSKLPTGALFQSRNSGESVPCSDKWSKRTGRILADRAGRREPWERGWLPVCYFHFRLFLSRIGRGRVRCFCLGALIRFKEWEGHDFFRQKILKYSSPPPPPPKIKNVPSLIGIFTTVSDRWTPPPTSSPLRGWYTVVCIIEPQSICGCWFCHQVHDWLYQWH